MEKKTHITLFTLTAALAVVLLTATGSHAQKGEGGPICTYERSQAMAAGRAGDRELADLLWQVYWDYLHDR